MDLGQSISFIGFTRNGETRFGQLKRQMPGISSKMLTERLRTLEKAEIIYRHQEPTVPPQVSYGLTKEGRELTTILDQLNTLAHNWEEEAQEEAGDLNRRGKTEKTILKIS